MSNRSNLAIATDDWHITADRPVNRLPGYVGQQYDKVEQILKLCQKYDADLFNAGDVFDRARVPRWLTSKYMYLFRQYGSVHHYACAGQHDQIFHSADLRDTSFQQFVAAGFIERGGNGIQTCDWGVDISKKKGIVISHTCTTAKPNPFIDYSITSGQLMSKTVAQIIVTGDYHDGHFLQLAGRMIVNAGSIMRIGADNVKKKPSVYLINTDTAQVVDTIELNVKPAEEVFDLEGIEDTKQRRKDEEIRADRFNKYLTAIKQETIKPDFPKILTKVIADTNPDELTKEEIGDILHSVSVDK